MASNGRKIVSIVSKAIEPRLSNGHVRDRNPTGREHVYCLAMNGVPAIELRVVMEGSRSVEGVALQIGTAGRADESLPLYAEYPGQGPTLASVYDLETGWRAPWNEETIVPRIEAAAEQHWAGWLEHFRTQWTANRAFWLDAMHEVPAIEDLHGWILGNELAHGRLRFPVRDIPATGLTRYGDEFVFAILGFADFIEQVVGEPLAVADVEMIRSVAALCREALGTSAPR